jgi:tripartite-type tricarboxylate transporter receptor subunit TctC
MLLVYKSFASGMLCPSFVLGCSMQRRSLLALCAAPAFGSLLSRAMAQAKNTVILSPFPAGGVTDLTARNIAPLLSKALGGQTVIVENLTGASGSIAANKMFMSPMDGTTLMMVSPSETILPPLMMSAVKFKSEDFRLLVNGPSVAVALLTRNGLNFKDVGELIAYAKNPANKPLSYGSLGIGSVAHLAAEHFSELAGVKMTHVPYRGGAPVLADLVGNQVDLSFFPVAGASMQMIDSGKLKCLGIALPVKLPQYSKYDVLTSHPALKSFIHTAWQSIAVPKATPAPVVEKLHKELSAIFQGEELRAFAAKQGSYLPEPATLAQIEANYLAEISRTRALAKLVKLEAQ